jgi:hypothetical protein
MSTTAVIETFEEVSKPDLGTKQNPAKLEFEITDKANDDQSSKKEDEEDFGSDEGSGGNFLFEDIRDELSWYEKQELTSFQKINMFFNKITNPHL